MTSCKICKHNRLTGLYTIRVPQYEGPHTFHEAQRGLCWLCVQDAIAAGNAGQTVRARAGLEPIAVQVLVSVPVIVGGNGSWTTYKTSSGMFGERLNSPDQFDECMSYMAQNCVEEGFPAPRVVTLEAWVDLPMDAVIEAEVKPSEQPRKPLWRQEDAK